MLKLFNRKKKDNKGFTLVELVIVVAILAILVGLLAPQYTKYVEKSRKAADVSNLDNIVSAFKVAASDTDYDIKAGTYTITMSTTQTTVTTTATETAASGQAWTDALKEYTGYDIGTDGKLGDLKLKSTRWTGGTTTGQIGATIEVGANNSVKVTYDPTSVKETTK